MNQGEDAARIRGRWTWVHKSIPWMGWTGNLAKPEGARWLIILFGLPVVMLVLGLLVALMLAAPH